MEAKALRLHAANDLRVDTFELPPIKEDEILVKVVSDSICMSTYKCAILGTGHKRVHPDVAEHPAIMGHEFAGDIVEVGAKYKDQYKPGMKFTIQPALNYKGTMWSPGYSYEFCGGDATYCILPAEVMECGCMLEYTGEAYYEASLAEPMSCSIGAFNAAYHTQMGVYTHEMGIKKDGRLAIMAGAGPMGLGALTYALHRDIHPSMVVVTDINQDRLDRARRRSGRPRASNCTLSTPAFWPTRWPSCWPSAAARATTTCCATRRWRRWSPSPRPSWAGTAA